MILQKHVFLTCFCDFAQNEYNFLAIIIAILLLFVKVFRDDKIILFFVQINANCLLYTNILFKICIRCTQSNNLFINYSDFFTKKAILFTIY